MRLLADSARGLEGANDGLVSGLGETLMADQQHWQRDLECLPLLNNGRDIHSVRSGCFGVLEKRGREDETVVIEYNTSN